ncbi:MAG: terminase small subunit [Roseiarcus sp.]
MTTPEKLTPKQKRFIEEFLLDLNGTAAYKRAGYNAKGHGAEVNAAKLLSNTEVASAISAAQAKRSRRTEVTADRVIQELAAIAFADPRKLFNADGSMNALHEVDDNTRGALVVEVNQGMDSEGNPTFTRKTKFACKLVALDRLARHLGLLNDKITVKGDAQDPIRILIQSIQGSAIKPVIEGRSEDEYEWAA